MTAGKDNKRRSSALILVLIAALHSAPLMAATVPTGYTDAVFASGFSNPTAMEFAPDGRLFVLQQGGTVRVVKNGALLSTPFLTLTVDSSGERGLLGIAFDPAFASNGWVYLYYTQPGTPARNRIIRVTAAGDVAAAGSTVGILDLDALSSATNHNGGAIHFGPDGKLYIAVGDNATSANAQTLTSRHGKMLRVNADGTAAAGNPFATAPQVWALGLRNPYTFAFDAGSGRMHINDVGQNTWEEINVGSAGANYGWPQTEGPTSTTGVTGPVYAYQHGSGTPTGCAITGGAFWRGRYYFADFCSGWIYGLNNTAPETASQFATTIAAPVDLKTGPDDALYYLARSSGAVGVIRAPASATTRVPMPGAAQVALALTLGAAALVAVRRRAS